MKIIDAHAHIYPEKIANKAADTVGEFYNIKMNNDGTKSSLLESIKNFDVEKVVISSVATTPHQVLRINDFMASSKDDLFLPLATLHPDMDMYMLKDEIQRIEELGLSGVKLHPDFQEFKISGKRGRKIFDSLGEYKLPILVHTGDKRWDYSHPSFMIEVAKDYPHLTFIAAHFGGWSEWEYVMKYNEVENVMFDTSSSLGLLDNNFARLIIKGIGENRFMFGTDYPMWEIASEIDKLLALDFDDELNDKIFYQNAKKLFGIQS